MEGRERRRSGKREREMGTRIRFGARFMRRTVGNNRSGNSPGIVSAGAVHSTPQTLSFEPLARSCSSSSLSLLSTPYPCRRRRRRRCLFLLPARHATNDDLTGVKPERSCFIFLPLALSSSSFHLRPEAFFFILPTSRRSSSSRVHQSFLRLRFDAGRW